MNYPLNLLHAPSVGAGMKCYGCPVCQASVLTTEPINMIFLCTLCEEVLVEQSFGGVMEE